MELYTRRSISECMSEAWTLMSTNLQRITKSLWLPILLFSVVSGIFAPLMFNMEKHAAEGELLPSDGIFMLVGIVALIVAVVYLHAKIFKLVNEQTTKFCVMRIIRLYLITAIIGIVLGLIAVALIFGVVSATKTGSVSVVIGILMGFFALLLFIVLCFVVITPIYFANTKYMIEPEMKLKDYWKAYKTGYKNFGKILGLILLCGLIVYIAQTFISMPGTIAMIAANFSLQGVANGDPDGLPGSFAYIYGATAFISTIVTSVLMIWSTFSQYYLYAAIEAKQRSLS